MILNVVDLELDGPDIIQIGGWQINSRTGYLSNELNLIVNPNKKIDERIIKLTGLTQETVDAGIPLENALIKMWAWMGSKHMMAWGNDCQWILNASDKLKITYSDKLHFYDLAQMYALIRCAWPQSKSESGLGSALELFGLKFDGKRHQAHDDAKNAAILAYHFVKCFRSLYLIKAEVAGL